MWILIVVTALLGILVVYAFVAEFRRGRARAAAPPLTADQPRVGVLGALVPDAHRAEALVVTRAETRSHMLLRPDFH